MMDTERKQNTSIFRVVSLVSILVVCAIVAVSSNVKDNKPNQDKRMALVEGRELPETELVNADHTVRLVPFFRYWNAGAGDHFYTTNAHEIGTTRPGVVGRHGYKSEGIACWIATQSYGELVPLYRYWRAGGADHFYTTNAGEIGVTRSGQVGRHGYTSEGIAGYCSKKRRYGSVALLRYWNPFNTDHFYTTNWGELGHGRHGYRYEGVQCYVWRGRFAHLMKDARSKMYEDESERVTAQEALPVLNAVPRGMALMVKPDFPPGYTHVMSCGHTQTGQLFWNELNGGLAGVHNVAKTKAVALRFWDAITGRWVESTVILNSNVKSVSENLKANTVLNGNVPSGYRGSAWRDFNFRGSDAAAMGVLGFSCDPYTYAKGTFAAGSVYFACGHSGGLHINKVGPTAPWNGVCTFNTPNVRKNTHVLLYYKTVAC